MMISTKGRYALRVMIDLAQQNLKSDGNNDYISLKAISERQQISMKKKLIRQLHKQQNLCNQ